MNRLERERKKKTKLSSSTWFDPDRSANVKKRDSVSRDPFSHVNSTREKEETNSTHMSLCVFCLHTQPIISSCQFVNGKKWCAMLVATLAFTWILLIDGCAFSLILRLYRWPTLYSETFFLFRQFSMTHLVAGESIKRERTCFCVYTSSGQILVLFVLTVGPA